MAELCSGLKLDQSYDTVIVGAGPAGLFCALELSRLIDSSKVLVIDKGPAVDSRSFDSWGDVSSGIGGAGLFSNGALYFDSNAGGFLEDWDPSTSQDLMTYLKSLFQDFTNLGPLPAIKSTYDLEERLVGAGFNVKRLDRIFHIGSDNTGRVIQAIARRLASRGVSISANTNLTGISLHEAQKAIKVKCEGQSKIIRCKNLVLAPGKVGAQWVENIADELGMAYERNFPYVGVRVETLSESFEPLAKLSHDPKISLNLGQMKVKTHCACPEGYSIPVEYGDIVLVDGISYKSQKSLRSSFNVLVRSPQLSVRAARKIASSANALGNGFPLIQTFGDFRRCRATSPADVKRNKVEPTLTCSVPSDITQVLPDQVTSAIVDFIKKLGSVILGIESSGTIIYAPVVEWWTIRMCVDRFMETNVDGIYAIGDGGGHSQGITMAAASGILAARGMIRKNETSLSQETPISVDCANGL
jgi:uncharacterized FAD-dependent dehydrogenase